MSFPKKISHFYSNAFRAALEKPEVQESSGMKHVLDFLTEFHGAVMMPSTFQMSRCFGGSAICPWLDPSRSAFADLLRARDASNRIAVDIDFRHFNEVTYFEIHASFLRSGLAAGRCFRGSLNILVSGEVGSSSYETSIRPPQVPNA